MNFLVRLQQFWKRISQKSEKLPPSIQLDERLSRYILSKRFLKKYKLSGQESLHTSS